MKHEEIMKQPDGIVFHENDIIAPPLFQKILTVEDDIIVRQFDGEFEQSRMGWREMSETDKNSRDYRILSHEQLDAFSGYIALAYLQETNK
jgi:hypothetical protein